MRAAKTGLEPAGQILVDQDGVEIDRRLWHADTLAARRDAGMQVGQGFAVIEPFGLGHETFDKSEHTVGAVDETVQGDPPVGAVVGAILVEPGFGAGGIVGRRQPEQGQEIPALEMRAFFLELGPTFRIDQLRGGFGKIAERIAVGGLALGFDEDRPAGSEAAERVVEPRGDRDQLGGRRGIEVRTAEFRGALERAVLVEDDAFTHERRPGQEVGEALRAAAVFGEVHHGSRPHPTRCCG